MVNQQRDTHELTHSPGSPSPNCPLCIPIQEGDRGYSIDIFCYYCKESIGSRLLPLSEAGLTNIIIIHNNTHSNRRPSTTKVELIKGKMREVCPKCGEPSVKPQGDDSKTCGTCAFVRPAGGDIPRLETTGRNLVDDITKAWGGPEKVPAELPQPASGAAATETVVPGFCPLDCRFRVRIEDGNFKGWACNNCQRVWSSPAGGRIVLLRVNLGTD